MNRCASTLARSLGLKGEFFSSHLARRGYVTVEMPDGPPIRLWSAADDWSTSLLWWYGYQAVEREAIDLWRARAAEAGTVLDIGAHVGWLALVAAQAGASRVFAFEANPRVAARCGLNVELNPWPITIVPNACSDRTGPVAFHLGGPGMPSSSGVDGLAGSYEQVRVGAVRIDDFVEQWGVDRVDLVKIDVEGHEPAVLRGMRATLERDRPAVFFEMIAAAPTGPEIIDVLSPLGYRYSRLTDAGPVRIDEPTAPVSGWCNYLAVADPADPAY